MVAIRKGIDSALGSCERITRLGAIQSQKTREIEVLQQKSYDVVPRSHLFFSWCKILQICWAANDSSQSNAQWCAALSGTTVSWYDFKQNWKNF